MTDKQFYYLFSEAINEPDRDVYISDYALSSIWGEDPETLPPLEELADTCGTIWDLAHITIKEIRSATGLSQAAFATRFCIPRRTVENWESGVNQCPHYVRLMLARLCGLAEGIV